MGPGVWRMPEGLFIRDERLASLLNEGERFLVGGLGGGCDIGSALLMAFALALMDKEIYLCGVHRSDVRALRRAELVEEHGIRCLAKVGPASYWHRPERLPEPVVAELLTLDRYGLKLPGLRGERVFVISRSQGVSQIAKALAFLKDSLGLDGIILVDGGGDSLVFGHEPALATAIGDAMTIAALSDIDSAIQGVVALGADVEIPLKILLSNLRELGKKGALLGGLRPEGRARALFLKASSILLSRIRSNSLNIFYLSVRGFRGTMRVRRAWLKITPLQAYTFLMDPKAVAEHSYLVKLARDHDDFTRIKRALEDFRRLKGLA